MPSMLYPELYKSLEAVRWDMDKDIDWAAFDASSLSDEQAQELANEALREARAEIASKQSLAGHA